MNTVTRIHYSECSDKKAINPAYAQLIVLQKFKAILLRICLAVCLIFAGYAMLSFFFGFCVCFSRIHLQVRGDFYDTRDEESIQTDDNCITVS